MESNNSSECEKEPQKEEDVTEILIQPIKHV